MRFALVQSLFDTHPLKLDAAKDISESIVHYTYKSIGVSLWFSFHFFFRSDVRHLLSQNTYKFSSFPSSAFSLVHHLHLLIFIIILVLFVALQFHCVCLFCATRFDNNRLMFNEITSQTFDMHTHTYLDGKNDDDDDGNKNVHDGDDDGKAPFGCAYNTAIRANVHRPNSRTLRSSITMDFIESFSFFDRNYVLRADSHFHLG